MNLTFDLREASHLVLSDDLFQRVWGAELFQRLWEADRAAWNAVLG